MKFLGFCIIVLVSLSAEARYFYQNVNPNQNLNMLGCVDCFNFVAPAVLGAENVSPAQIGLIVYDSSLGAFRGYNQAGLWTKLSNDNVVNTVTTSGAIPVTWETTLSDTSSGSITLTLPTAASVPGRVYTFKKISASNILTIDGYGTETIDGQLQVNLISNNSIIQVMSDGSNFRIKEVSDKWRVDAVITDPSADLNLGTSSVSSFSEITDGSMTLTNSTDPGVVAAKIACSGTNSPSGTTCSSGNESMGVSFDLPKVGAVRACVSFTHYLDVAANSRVRALFKMVETPTNAQTISQDGKTKVYSSVESRNSTTVLQVMHPHQVCGTFNFTSSGTKMLRLMYEEQMAGTPNGSYVLGGSDNEIHWEVYPL
jgi:hypothetical protein